MPTDDKFAEAWLHQEHTVLGRQLRPYSLWHQLMLQVLNSPVVSGGVMGPVELEVASQVCSRAMGPMLVRPRHPLRIVWAMRWGGFKAEQAAFKEYLDDYISMPEYAVRDDPAPTVHLGQPPHLLALAAKLIGWSGWPEAYVWNLELGKAYWYGAMVDRAGGAKLDFRGQEDKAFLEALKAKYAQRSKSVTAKN